MDKKDIRALVVQQSGRYDLVGMKEVGGVNEPDYEEDLGVDFFIDSAIDTLSREVKISQNLRVAVKTIDEGEAGLHLDGLVAVNAVKYAGRPIGRTTQEQVLAFIETASNYTGPPEAWFTLSTKEEIHEDYGWDNGSPATVGIFPLPDAEYSLVVSYWAVEKLADGDAENWWTIVHPKAVVDLACAEIDSAASNADRRNLDITIERLIRNLISRDIQEETFFHSGVIT